MTEKTETQTAMSALDAGIVAVGSNPEIAEPCDPAPMPSGHEQIDSDMTPAQMRRIRATMYLFHGFVGIVLLPFALILRTGRWSMRTLIAHHNGWEFGGW